MRGSFTMYFRDVGANMHLPILALYAGDRNVHTSLGPVRSTGVKLSWSTLGKTDTELADFRRQKQAASEMEGMRQKHAQACSNRRAVLVTERAFPKAVAALLCQFCSTGSKAECRGWMSSASGSL